MVALCGRIGVGKSQIAREYAHLSRDRYSLRWHIPARDPGQIIAALTVLAGKLGLDTEGEPNQLIAAVRDELDCRSGWLLIFDDVDASVDLLRYLPTNGGGQVLITSRYPSWSDVAHSIRVDCLEVEEAVEFLQTRTNDPDRAAAEQLAQELGRLPLALAQAADYVERTPGMTLERCVHRFGEVHRRLLEDGRPNGYPASLAAMVKLNIEPLQSTDPEAIDLLHLCAFLAPEPDSIALKLVRAGADHLPRHLSAAVRDSNRLDQLTTALYSRSLVGWDREDIRVHRLVQRIVLDQISQQQARAWATRAVRVVLATLPDTPADPRRGPQSAYVVPHARAVRRHAGPEDAQKLLIAIGAHLGENGGTMEELGDALDHLTRALDLARRRHGTNHPEVARILGNLGAVHGRMARLSATRQGRLGELAVARSTLEQAVQISEAASGPDDPSVAYASGNLGIVLHRQGDRDGARKAFQRELRILEAAYGRDCLEGTKALANLGAVLADLGEHRAAEGALQRALRTQREMYESDDVQVALTLCALGHARYRQRKLSAARDALETALRIFEDAYGPAHPHSAMTSIKLGRVLFELGRLRAGVRHIQRGAVALRLAG